MLTPYVQAVVKGEKHKLLTDQWLIGCQAILDAYLGACPEHFVYEEKMFTPQSFAESLQLNWDDYVSLTS